MQGSSPEKSGLFREKIRIRGARVHNLRNLDIDLPRDKLTIVTGVSGSGKSSLAFDTIYAEGQRQYIETLSTYARQFLDQIQRPDVDLIDGLEPTLCIDQRVSAASPRSTVGTVTEVYDYLRLLFARVGIAHCPRCQQPIMQQTPEQIEQSLQSLPERTKVMILAPMVRGRRGSHLEVFEEIRKAGLVRARVDGELYDLESVPTLSARQNHSIDAVVDRLIIKPDLDQRLANSIRLALRLGEGTLTLMIGDSSGAQWDERLMSTKYACLQCGTSFPELEPRTFSFNSPYGACPTCDGMGVLESIDQDLLISNWDQSPQEGAILPLARAPVKVRRPLETMLRPVLESLGGGWELPLSQLKPAARTKLLEGSNRPAFVGLRAWLESERQETQNTSWKETLHEFVGACACSTCRGGRLRAESLSVRVAERTIHELSTLALGELSQWFDSVQFAETQAKIAHPVVTEIRKRLSFLQKVGVTYLTLDRQANTLSGGELQRVRLATSIGSGLVGVCYVLDEPSIGLHPRDNDRLIEAVRNLQSQGNTVIVVEHDEATIRAADWVIDMGPGAGTQGGQVIAQGTPEEIQRDLQSVTGGYLSGKSTIPVARTNVPGEKTNWLVLEEASGNNLKRVTARFPLGCLVGVTGVSGSGKSSLIVDTLYPAVAKHLRLASPKPGPYNSLRGEDFISQLIWIDQSSIGRSPRSCPATYTGAFDEIRKVFASSRDAKQRGFASSRFSFNAPDGRCPQCKGQGVEKVEMNFLSDLIIPCSLCSGRRFNRQTLQVRYKGASIADVLAMTVAEGVDFFANFPKLSRILQALQAVGLGYVQLGQPSTTLSGGEAQRIKLATELSRTEAAGTLYMLDEPTTGLHFEDVKRLLVVLQQLVLRGNTVIVIEHNLDVIKCCDWLIDLGPEGGAGGGEIIAVGTPEEVAKSPQSFTGQYLNELFAKRSVAEKARPA